MAYPSDVLIPSNAKYYGFIDTRKYFCADWDITWSFTFALTGTEHAFCTFLTTNKTLSSAIPGQYLGYLKDVEPSRLLTEDSEEILTEDSEYILIDYYKEQYLAQGILGIAFDSTGLFAAANEGGSEGINAPDAKQNSLIIRDNTNKLIFNEHLSSLDSEFFLSNNNKSFQTLKFTLTNSGKKIHIDYKTDSTSYKNLTTIQLSGFSVDRDEYLYPGLTFCSPISSSSANISTMFIKNFNFHGTSTPPNTEKIHSEKLDNDPTTYTTISEISSYDFSFAHL